MSSKAKASLDKPMEVEARVLGSMASGFGYYVRRVRTEA
jgi:hypothetical protein